MCSHVCIVCYWLIGDALLMYSGVVSMRLHVPCFDVCWEFRCGWLGWYPCGRLKHNCLEVMHKTAEENKMKILKL